MKPNKSNPKLKLNKSDNQKSKSKTKLKISLSPNKSSYNIKQYIKNKNDLIISTDNIIKKDEGPYKSIFEDKDKLINLYKTRYEKEKLINKNLWHELHEYKSAMNKSKENYNKMMNKKQTKNEELIVITNKLTKLIEMVINFSYSMAYLRSNIYSKNKRRFNESTLAYESLNNNLKQIYNEFLQINKNLKNVKVLNDKTKQLSKSPINSAKIKKLDIIETKKRNSFEKKVDTTKSIINNLNIYKDNKDNTNKNERNNLLNPIIYKTEGNINSPIKEENSIDLANEENEQNISPKVKKNLENKIFSTSTEDEKYKEPKEEDKKISPNYKKINNINIIPQINERESLKRSEKIFTFRNNSNNSQLSKDEDKLSGKINLGDSQKLEYSKLVEENKNLKIQLASEKLKGNNNLLNNSKSESHNDEEYEEIISELKKKLEEKDNTINELQKKLDSKTNINNIDTDNNIINENMNKTNNERICNNINVNVNLTEIDKIKGNYQENINTIKSIYERMMIEKENKINELNNEINIIEKELEELNDKFDKEREINRLNVIKINELENEKISLLTEIKNLKALN
jgi:hypothetical protein